MYQNLVRALTKIVESKDTPENKLMKIGAILDFASTPQPPQPQNTQPVYPPLLSSQPLKPTVQSSGAIVGVENV